jgi:hypothetical protein
MNLGLSKIPSGLCAEVFFGDTTEHGNAVAQLHFQVQVQVSNQKCGCATAFPGPSLSIKPEMWLCNCISGPPAEKKFCQPPCTEGNGYFIPLTYIHKPSPHAQV